MNSIISKAFTAITLAFGVCCCLSLNAQVQTQTSTQAGIPSRRLASKKAKWYLLMATISS